MTQFAAVRTCVHCHRLTRPYVHERNQFAWSSGDAARDSSYDAAGSIKIPVTCGENGLPRRRTSDVPHPGRVASTSCRFSLVALAQIFCTRPRQSHHPELNRLFQTPSCPRLICLSDSVSWMRTPRCTCGRLILASAVQPCMPSLQNATERGTSIHDESSNLSTTR